MVVDHLAQYLSDRKGFMQHQNEERYCVHGICV